MTVRVVRAAATGTVLRLGVLLLAIAGCASPDPAARPVGPGSTTGAPLAGTSATATAHPTTPPTALCAVQRPAPRDPFPFNRDAARRDQLVGVPTGAEYSGGIESFGGLTVGRLAQLIEGNFIDPYDRQNAAPTVWEIFQFLCGHPTVRAAGYVVSLERPDYRTSIEAVYARAIDPVLRADAERFCVDADEIILEQNLECFWD